MAFTDPKLKDMHIFGCIPYVKVPDELRRKLENKAKKLHFVGYSEQSKAFRLLDKKTSKIIISRNVIFLDDKQKQEEHSEKMEIVLELKQATKENEGNEEKEEEKKKEENEVEQSTRRTRHNRNTTTEIKAKEYRNSTIKI